MEPIESRVDLHRARIIGAIAAVHFLLSVALFLLNGAISMSRFDGGGPSDLTALLLKSAFEFLSFPLLMGLLLLKIANTGLWDGSGFSPTACCGAGLVGGRSISGGRGTVVRWRISEFTSGQKLTIGFPAPPSLNRVRHP